MLDIVILPLGELKTNCYIVSRPGAGEAVVIDPGDGALTLANALAGKTAAGALLTHGHCDHILGLSALPDAPVYVHEADAPMLTDANLNCCNTLKLPCPTRAFDHLVHEGDVIRLAGIYFTVLHTPGHTPGGACYLAEDCLFTGDTLFAGGYGRTDLPGGDWHQLTRSLRRLLRMDGALRVFPGHGAGTTMARERGEA